MQRMALLFLLPLLGCNDPDSKQDSSTAPEETGNPQDSTSPPHTGESGEAQHTGDTGSSTQPMDVEITDLSWRLHDDVPSMVYVSWEQSAAATVYVEYGFEGAGWMQAPTLSASAGTNQQLLVGIPYDEAVGWRVVVEGGQAFEGENMRTGPLPDGLPVPTLEVSKSDAWLPSGNYLLTSINQNSGGWTGGTYWTFIIDRQGRPVWANETPDRNWTLFAQVSASGDYILWDEATAWSDYDDGAGSKVHYTYLDGEIDVVSTPGLHHAFVQLPDGTLAWGSQYHGGYESLVEKAPGAKNETVLWSCQDDWPSSGHCESNGLFYVVDTNSFLYSFYTNDSVVEVDRATGESLWWAGDVPNGYGFDPQGSQFSWQHGISYTDTGTLLVSTFARNDSGSTTMVREYQVDHEARLLHEVWNYDPGVHAVTNGDAWRLENGNTLHLLGSAAEIFEVTPKKEVVWHLDYDSTQLLGRGEFIEDLYDLVSETEKAGRAEQ